MEYNENLFVDPPRCCGRGAEVIFNLLIIYIRQGILHNEMITFYIEMD